MDSHRLRAIILDIEYHLSDEDRRRLHFYVAGAVPRRLRDDPSLAGTLNIMEKLIEERRITENDLTFLIDAFDHIHCMNAVELLRGHLRRNQSKELNQSVRDDISSVMPHMMITEIDDEQEDTQPDTQYPLIRNQQNISQDGNNTLISNNMNVNSQMQEIDNTIPLRGSAIDILPNAKWKTEGITRQGRNGYGNGTNQLTYACGLYVDDDQTIYVADFNNHRILEWRNDSTNDTVVAGGNGQGNGTNQLYAPWDVIVDKERDNLIICDQGNRRVLRWSRRNGHGSSGETIISNISCRGLTMDENGFLYVVDIGNHQVRRYQINGSDETVVAGINGYGSSLSQLNNPNHVFVDQNHSVYVSDSGNHRVMKWEKDATRGSVVAGGNGNRNGRDLKQLNWPAGLVVDQSSTVYVADQYNDRIMRWTKESTQGSIIAGDNSPDGKSNQFNRPLGLSFDRDGNLYVIDSLNHRVQQFEIEQTIK